MDIVPEAEIEVKKRKIRDETKILTEAERLQTVSQPVIIDIKLDEESMQKRVIYKTNTHVYKEEDKKKKVKEYKHTRILTEVSTQSLLQSDIDHSRMKELQKSIYEEVMKLDLSDIKINLKGKK